MDNTTLIRWNGAPDCGRPSRRLGMPKGLLAAVLALLSQLPRPAAADGGETVLAGLPSDLTELSLDQLLNIEITSVSRRPEKISDAAAAVYVLTGEDMHRYGAHSIAEALRLVPGLEVARTNSHSYAISARGFNSTNADKLQVLIDGRSVYTPLTSAVFWDVLDTRVDDIERIEVIRGPGAALWGANAVNGVINIVTRNSRDTLGTVLSGGAGTDERARAAIRSGTRLGDDASLRFYAKARELASAVQSDGSDADDAARSYQAGLRSDWQPRPGQALTVSADAYSARFDTAASVVSPSGDPTDASGANLVARWASGIDTRSSWALQTYYDEYRRMIPGVYSEKRGTFDLDFQHQLLLGGSHALIYGLGYRNTHDNTGEPPSAAIVFLPPSRTLQTESAFVQDQWSLDDGRLVVTAGSKFEHDDFNRIEAQPGLRIGWRAAQHAFTWAAISRAVRTPNRVNSDIAVYCPPPNGYPGACGPGLFRVGNPSLRSEKLTAYEWGLRIWSEHNLSFDLAAFYNVYRDLLSQEAPGAGTPFGSYDNKVRAKGYGGELVVDWKPRSDINLQTFYGFLRIDAARDANSTDSTTVKRLEGSDPRHQAGLRASTQPAERWVVDGFLRYVDGLSYFSVPAYTELNLRVAYQLTPAIELALAGQNLLAPRHAEFGSVGNRGQIQTSAVVQRSALVGFTWHWQ